MLPSDDGEPAVGEDRNMLGLRPGEADLSVFLDPKQIPNPIRPKAVMNLQDQPGLNAETVLYALDQDELSAFQLGLGAVGKRTHAAIGPIGACDHDELQRRLIAMRLKWRKV